MSQSWHAHWANDAFKSTRLQNWEVPKWHNEWPDRHCTTSVCQAHQNGRLFASAKTSANRNPWGNFKGTWDLPLRIDRHTADKLSRCNENKKKLWIAHKAKHQIICKRIFTASNSIDDKNKINENRNKKEEKEVQDEETIKKIQSKDKNRMSVEIAIPVNNCKIK